MEVRQKVIALISDTEEHDRVMSFLLLGTFFTLPSSMRANNYLLSAFLIIGLLRYIRSGTYRHLGSHLKSSWPVWGLCLLAIQATVIGFEGSYSMKYLEKFISALVIPVLFAAKIQKIPSIDRLLQALLLGSLTALTICYFNAFYEMIVGGEPFSYLFRWRHLGHKFTAVADTHPAYLGFFIVVSTYYLLLRSEWKMIYKGLIFVFFIAGLLQLSARLSLGMFGLVVLLFLGEQWKSRRLDWRLLAAAFLPFALFLALGSEYLTERIFRLSSYFKDERFARLDVSFELFKEYPLTGVGYGAIQEMRMERYLELGYETAYKLKYNAHNQFVEYLSMNGIIGGAFYIAAFFFLFRHCFRKKLNVYLVLLGLFFLFNLTESTMVRIKGLEFYVLVASLALSSSTNITKPNRL